MKAMAAYVMRGRFQAITLASIFAVLSLILPPLSYLSGGVLALVTLRKGIIEGVLLTFVSTILLAVMSYGAMGSVIVAIVFASIVWVPILLLSMVLRATVSLSLTMVLATAFSITAVIGFHIVVVSPVEWWTGIMSQVLEQAMQQPGMEMMGDKSLLQQSTAQMMTAIMSAAFLASMVLSLFIGRWWQALLYNPGGFQQEFYQFRIDKIFAAVAAVILVWAAISAKAGSLSMDVAVLVCVYASVAGIALIHDWVNKSQANKAWLILMYLLLVFIAPQLLMLLAILGFMDAWLNLRKFYQNKSV